MPQDGSVQAAVKTIHLGGLQSGSLPIEMGARGEATEVIGLHLITQFVPAVGTSTMLVGLSSNPSHELTPPATENAFLDDQAIYGTAIISVRQSTLVGNVLFPERFVPLYGIVRPRRQIIVWTFGLVGGDLRARVEVYYRPTTLNKTELESLNLKYGKYRRSA